jgi:uncharacterized protein
MLEDKINEDIKAAMFAKDKDKLEALRGIKAAILLLRTEKSATAEVTPDAEIKLLQKLIKQRKESGDIYRQQNREDLAKVEFFQASVIENYLPKQVSEEEVQAIVARIVKDTGASSIKDMGKVIGLASKELAGKAENKTIAEIVKKLLNIS